MTLDLIRIGLDEPGDYHVGIATILRRRCLLELGQDASAVVLGQSQPILTAGDQPTDVPAEPTARPGGPTYFGPGVLLVSPVVRAVPALVHEALLLAGEETCAEYGVTTERRFGHPGLWVTDGHHWSKLASIGLAHEGVIVAGGGGLALNVDPDLSAFDDFEACNIPGVVMTSLAAEAERALTVAEVAETMAGHLERLLTPLLLGPATA